MISIQKSAVIKFTAEQMFKLVDKVEEYPLFLPWCVASEIQSRDEKITLATIHINYHHIKLNFTTLNNKEFPSLIKMQLQQGPFSHLEGYWRFIPLNNEACKIDFNLHYQFSSKIFEKIGGPIFNYIANNLVTAFIKRAEEVYGSQPT